jgi:DNA-binding XRE family transcriptional regulator
MIYFVRCALTSRVKIGFSEKPWLRLVKIQVDCPTELSLAAVLDGDVDAERAFHARFKEHRIRGEWFSESGSLKEFLREQPTPKRPPSVRKLRVSTTRLGDWFNESGLTDADVSRETGVSQTTICRVRRGHYLPRLKIAQKLANYVGVPVRELFPVEAAIREAVAQ